MVNDSVCVKEAVSIDAMNLVSKLDLESSANRQEKKKKKQQKPLGEHLWAFLFRSSLCLLSLSASSLSLLMMHRSMLLSPSTFPLIHPSLAR